MTRRYLPSDLLALAKDGILPSGPVALDTETSGLHPDDGARVSTVSIAWADPDSDWAFVKSDEWPGGIQTYRTEEVDGELPVTQVVSFAWPYDQGVEGTGKPEDTGAVSLWDQTSNLPEDEWLALLAWLEIVGPACGLTMANSKFDCHMMRAGIRAIGGGAELMDLVTWDTQTANDLLYGWMPSALKGKGSVSEMLWGEQESDEQQVIKKYLRKHKLPAGRWDLMPWDIIAKYADQDARLTCRLRIHQEHQIHNLGKPDWLDGREGRLTPERAMRRRMKVTAMLYRMEVRGLPFGVPQAGETVREVARRLRAAEKALPFAPATGPMAKHYWFGEGVKGGVQGQALPPIATTPTGQPKLTMHEVKDLVAAGYPGAKEWQELSKLQTADSMWYSGYLQAVGEDGRIRTNIKQFGTVSGRFSSTRVNVQSIPHDYRLSSPALEGLLTPRGLIVAGVPKGMKLWELDLANAELRVAATMAGCGGMLKLIRAGADLHGETAKQVFGVTEDDPEWDQLRTVGKRGNFSLIFGVGWETLQENLDKEAGVKLTDSEAQVFVRDWNRLYPEYKRAIDLHMGTVLKRQKTHGHGWIQMANGERRWFGRQEDAHKAFNQRVQPSLAQFGIEWWLRGERILRDKIKDPTAGLVCLIHDSMVVLVPDDRRGERIIHSLQRKGVELWERIFPEVPGGVDAKEFKS